MATEERRTIIDRWLQDRWWWARFIPWVLGIFVTVWGVVTFVTEHDGWRTGWSLFVAALGLIVILVSEMVRTKIRHKRGLVSPASNPNGSAPEGRKQPYNMDSFNELREATRPAPLTDPVTAFENRLERFNEGVLWKHKAETQATEETTTKRTRSVSGSRSGEQAGSVSTSGSPLAEDVLVPARAAAESQERKAKSDGLAGLLLEGDKRRIVLDEAEKEQWNNPDAPLPDGTKLRAWNEDCEKSVGELLGVSAVASMRMHDWESQGQETWREYVSAENADAYWDSQRYIAWLRIEMVGLEEPGSGLRAWRGQ